MRGAAFIVLLVVAAALVVAPFVFGHYSGASASGGSDVEAQRVIGRLAPAYRPWDVLPISKPSRRRESALFVLQALLGAGFLGYYMLKRERGSR